eukprot:m.642784 g.642784  ORF g.642784 m.642784 type:complete len:107 (-) comp22642_c1_seq3:1519-1839(-)
MFFTNALDTVKFHVDFLAGFELGNKNVVMHRRYTVRAKVFQLIALWDPDEVTRHDAVVGVHARGIIVSRDHVRTPLALHPPRCTRQQQIIRTRNLLPSEQGHYACT